MYHIHVINITNIKKVTYETNVITVTENIHVPYVIISTMLHMSHRLHISHTLHVSCLNVTYVTLIINVTYATYEKYIPYFFYYMHMSYMR